jgi:hypothetical protein
MELGLSDRHLPERHVEMSRGLAADQDDRMIHD